MVRRKWHCSNVGDSGLLTAIQDAWTAPSWRKALRRCTVCWPITALHSLARDFGRDGEELSCCSHRVPASLGSDSVQFGEQV